MADTRKLVVLFDGTWNIPGQTDHGLESPTNVAKFSKALASLNGMQRQQYEEGVGTGFEEYLPGGILGEGITYRLLKAYSFLQERYADKEFNHEDNRVFIFGFSRGAYTARLLSHLIDWSGVPKRSKDCEEGVSRFLERQPADDLRRSGGFFDIHVEMVGVWDAVKTALLGDYNDSRLPLTVAAGYHAMAIDEKRAAFPVLRWESDGRVKQMWFAGVHSNVGGGYADSGLSDIALQWMIYQARDHGLKFKTNVVNTFKPDPLGELRDSYREFGLPGENRREVLDGDLVHESVQQRIAAGTYSPDVAQWPANPCYSV
ncbi:MAG TPA: hypothetical protein DET40_23050 [Lentisphaeria bacterium]|nr:MAG: hypothetical protein A2X45_15735 [Lentisphaerae bacterium GWF2_50_93]HCE46432.1 hypothetical protein [Lentisphaeria bacterium]